MSGSQLQRLVEVMDTLRSPGGCPWDGEQTHESLVKYLLEESYEFVDALGSANRAGMREELGDVLLQVYFHARIAQEHPEDPFTIEYIARSIVEKLIRRHPHVFAGAEVSGTGVSGTGVSGTGVSGAEVSGTGVSGSEEVLANWESIKAAEKGRTSALDGIAMAQPALPLIEKLLYRAQKSGVKVATPDSVDINMDADENGVGKALLAVITWAHKNGIDAESALRNEARSLSEQITSIESR